MSENNIFSSRIKELRSSLGLSQTEFANSICVTQATLSSYENQKKNPSLDILKTISKTYDVSIDWLCGLSEHKPPYMEFNNYADFIRLLLSLNSVKHTSIGVNIIQEQNSSISLNINNKVIAEFFKEWKDMKDLCAKAPSGEILFKIWEKEVCERYNTPIPDYSPEQIAEVFSKDK